MRQKGLSQEWLKGIACLAMLVDHVGVVLFPWVGLRIIGRLAFPIYCFLLCEGAEHTRDPGHYGLRLAIGAALAELPFDILFHGGWSWGHSNVMVTLLLGLPVAIWFKKGKDARLGLLYTVGAVLMARLLGSDYGGMGILMILLFSLPGTMPVRALSMAVLSLATGEPTQLFALLSLIPIGLYTGEKSTDSKALQWAFYLFYPGHLLALLILKMGLI